MTLSTVILLSQHREPKGFCPALQSKLFNPHLIPIGQIPFGHTLFQKSKITKITMSSTSQNMSINQIGLITHLIKHTLIQKKKPGMTRTESFSSTHPLSTPQSHQPTKLLFLLLHAPILTTSLLNVVDFP